MAGCHSNDLLRDRFHRENEGRIDNLGKSRFWPRNLKTGSSFHMIVIDE